MNQNSSKKFLLEFFKDCIVKDESGVLTISNVPIEFENFVGKKAPYKFVFDINMHNKVKDSELIMQGSYFLLAIRDYLSDKGETCLLKMNIQPDLPKINKILDSKKYKLIEIKQEQSDFIYRFSFSSKYQYLNDKKQSMHTIFIKNEKLFDIDINKFNTLKGNSEQIPLMDLKQHYLVAKTILDEKVSQETTSIKSVLKEKLKKELFRVKDHYKKQIHEKDEEIESCVNKIKMLESKLKHTSYDRDRSIIKRMIRESTERLDMLEKKGYRERLKVEEKFHINDEVEKHVLSIKNNLINLTLFQYPLYTIQATNKGKKIILTFDPILNKIV